MKVFKFGGASIRHADAIRKVGGILLRYEGEEIIVIVSAMGKTTNALEKAIFSFQTGKDFRIELEEVVIYHKTIMKELFSPDHLVWNKVHEEFRLIENLLHHSKAPDERYDQIVSKGEIISSLIVADFLQQEGHPSTWIDARKFIVTDSNFREANVNWKATEKNINLPIDTIQYNTV